MSSARTLAKSALARFLRPALVGIAESQRRIEGRLTAIEQRLAEPASAPSAAVWRGGAEGRAIDPAGRERPELTRKLRGELDYWLHACRGVSGDPNFPTPEAFHSAFDGWQTRRLRELAVALGVAHSFDGSPETDAAMWAWCAQQHAVEIGGGPHPALAAAMNPARPALGWRSAVLADPLADAYALERLMPGYFRGRGGICLACAGESIPLASGATDLVIIENCLDHVVDPAAVLREISRILRPGGLLWLLVDTGDYQDEMHPHPMSEPKVRTLLAASGFSIRHIASWNGANSHPRAEGQVRALAERPVAP